jgi:hypothetical protein
MRTAAFLPRLGVRLYDDEGQGKVGLKVPRAHVVEAWGRGGSFR